MTVKLITAPENEPITKEEVKLHCRIDHDDEDNLIDAHIAAARQYAETTILWRALVTQELELVLDEFPVKGTWRSFYVDYKTPKNEILIPRPPLQEIISVKYTDSDGTEHDFEDYIVDDESEPGRIVPEKQWPTDNLYPVNAVRIRYKAGYGEPEDVPQQIKQALHLLVADMYEVRQTVVDGRLQNLNTAHLLLQPYRIFRSAGHADY